jgi:hypothetical protein
MSAGKRWPFTRLEVIAVASCFMAPFVVFAVPTALYRLLIWMWQIDEPLRADVGAFIVLPTLALGLACFVAVGVICCVLCDRAGMIKHDD